MNFDALAKEHKDAVYRQLIRACGNREDAEDALIEALLKAYRNLDQLHEGSAFRAWLAQIGRRVCWQLKAREALMPIVQLSAVEDEGREIADPLPTAEAQAARRQMKELLQRAVAALPEGEREVYQLRDIEEFSGDEVCRRLGITSAAMKSRLHRARANLRRYMDSELSTSNPGDFVHTATRG